MYDQLMLLAAVVMVGLTAIFFFHLGYNEALEDVKKTGRIPELEE